MHDAECMAAQTRRLFRVGWEGLYWREVRRAVSSPDLDEVRDARQDLARLFAGLTFLIEGVQNVLNQSVGDVGGKVGCREGSVIISSCSHVCTRRSAINNKPSTRKHGLAGLSYRGDRQTTYWSVQYDQSRECSDSRQRAPAERHSSLIQRVDM